MFKDKICGVIDLFVKNKLLTKSGDNTVYKAIKNRFDARNTSKTQICTIIDHKIYNYINQ